MFDQSGGLPKNPVVAHEPVMPVKYQPVIVEYNTVTDEMADITNKVKKLIERGIEPGRIGIIYKENIYCERLIRYFSLKKIPFFSKRDINILYDPFAKKIFQLLHYLAAEHDIPYSGDGLLFEIMHFDFYKIPPIEIAKLSVEANNRKYRGEPASIRKLLYDKANAVSKDLFDTGAHPGLKRFSKMIEQLIADVPNCTLRQLFENIICRGGVLGFAMKSNEQSRLFQMLTVLVDFIREETRRSPSLTLQALVCVFELMEKEKISLPMLQVSGNDRGVKLLTAHGSKGSEFEYVFVTGVNTCSWEKKEKIAGGYKFPGSSLSPVPAGDADEELRRLFYEAPAGGEKNLQVSYIKSRPDGRAAEQAVFIDEMVQAGDLPVVHIALPEKELVEFEALYYISPAPEIEKAGEDFITSLLDKYVMNITSLNNYLHCPLGFYFKNLLKIPSGKSENTAFGSAVHFAVQKFFEDMQKSEHHQFSPKETMIDYFRWYMVRHRENFTAEAFARRMEYGPKVLSGYYDNYISSWNKIVSVERNIRNIVVNGITLKGKIDKLEFNGKDVKVVDYKTGDIGNKYTLEKLSSPNDKQPNGGDYWRQAVFYKMLVDNLDDKGWKVVSTEFDFIEPDKKKGYQKRKIYIEPQDIETVTQQLTAVWQKIQARDFYTGCGKEECHWCNFVKDNKLEVALHGISAEAEQEI